MITRWRNCFFREQKREILNDVKYIWNNSFLNCGCRWRMIIAVNLFMLCCSKQETNFYLSPTNHQSQCMIYVLFLIVHLHESWACSLSPLILKSISHQRVHHRVLYTSCLIRLLSQYWSTWQFSRVSAFLLEILSLWLFFGFTDTS